MLDHRRFPLMPHAGARLTLRIARRRAAARARGRRLRARRRRAPGRQRPPRHARHRARRPPRLLRRRRRRRPALDRLAREGVRFAQASSPAPLTLPAHASLLSGLLPPRHGLRNNGAGAFPADRPTLATALAARRLPHRRLRRRLRARPPLRPRPRLRRSTTTRSSAAPTRRRASRPSGRGDRGGGPRARLAGAAGRGRRRPFFLWVHLYDAHAPYAPPAPFRERHAGRPYDGEIAFADAQVGRLLAALDRRGLAERHGGGGGRRPRRGARRARRADARPLPLRADAARAAAAARARDCRRRQRRRDAGEPRRPRRRPSPACWQGGLAVAAPEGLDGTRPLRRAPRRRASRPPPTSTPRRTTRRSSAGAGSPRCAGATSSTSTRRAPELYDLRRDPGETTNLAGEAGDGRGLRRAARRDRAPAPSSRAVAGAPTPRPARASRASATPPAAPPQDRSRTRRRAAPIPRTASHLFRRFEQAHNGLRDGRTAEAAACRARGPGGRRPREPGLPRRAGARPARERGELAAPCRSTAQAVGGGAGRPARPGTTWRRALQAGRRDRRGGGRRSREALRLDPAGRRPTTPSASPSSPRATPRRPRGEPSSAPPSSTRATPRRSTTSATSLRALGRPDEAEDAYRRALAAAPRYAEPLNGLGTLEVERDRPAAALPLFRARSGARSRATTRSGSTAASRSTSLGERAAAVAAYRDFLAATGGDPRVRRAAPAAQQLLARLAEPRGGDARRERR